MNEIEKLGREVALQDALEGYATGRLRFGAAYELAGVSKWCFQKHMRKQGITPRSRGGTPLQDWPELTAAIEGYISGKLLLKEAAPMAGMSQTWFQTTLRKRGLKRRKKNNP